MKKIVLLFVIITLLSNTLLAQVNLPLGLKAYYPFTGNANDVSGNNNNPVFNNATLTADRFGNPNSAYRFNGTSSYMRIPNAPSINMTNQMSIALWVKPMGFYTGTCHNNILVMKGDADFLTGNYYLRFTADPTQGCISNPNLAEETFWGANAFSPNPFIELNRWYSVIWTSDGTNCKIYVDCVLKGTAPVGSSTFTNSYDLFFGHLNAPAFPYWLNGDLDEVRIYDRALNQDEVNVLGGCVPSLTCTNWLRTQAVGQSVTIGDLDIFSNKVTIEANFNCSSFPINRPDKQQDIVSKHSNTTDANYVLRMDLAAITTPNGHYITPLPCDNLQLNKTYHVAMVYDGNTLKFYRNGFLLSQMPATGNLITNDLLTTIGDYAVNNPVGTNFLGYINEIRIWNVALTQTELRTYMNTSLPNPTTQTGLLGYYTFDNLLNKQGNAAYNGVLNGAATINNTTPNCNYVADSCAIVPTTGISNIINDYTPVLGLDKCKNIISVTDASKFNVGDTVLLIQMKGAIIDSTNTANFGTIIDYKNAGNYEFNYVKAKAGNNIELKNIIVRNYDIPNGKVQLIRVPYYQNVTVTNTLTAKAWDGSSGGVLVFNVGDTLNLNANIDVSGKGFKGGIGYNPENTSLTCFENNFFYPPNTLLAAQKGESISSISSSKSCGKGNIANGGGGGAGHNSGGGGGGNAGKGGFGGYQLDNCGNAPFDNRGIGGLKLTYSTSANKIFMGGAGGAGHADNTGSIPPAGGTGGGIVLITADKIKSNTKKIIANGDSGLICSIPPTANCHDGMGGGGAGGTVLLSINQYLDNSIIEMKGGRGANMVGPLSAGRIGPGGGGGGGLGFIKNASLPPNLNITATGGINGVITTDGNNPWGATQGDIGTSMFNLQLPIASVPFKNNIDSVRFSNTSTCNVYNFSGQAFTNTVGIQNWQWFFGDGGTANTQNTSHTYLAANTTYTVKLVVTDLNGCKDSISKPITTPPLFVADAGNDTAVCLAPIVTVQLNASAGSFYSWTPAGVLNNPSIRNPIATISATTKFFVTVTNAAGCSSIDSVTITLSPTINPALTINTPKLSICKGNSATFTAAFTNGGSNPIFQWYKNNITVGTNSSIYTDNTLNDGDIIKCKITSNISCASPNNAESNSITMTVANPSSNTRYPTVSTLYNQNTPLQARTFTGSSYVWEPNIGLNNNLIINPIFNYTQTREYLIKINTPIGCTIVDTQLVVINGKKGLYVPKAFSPNNNGANDRLYPILVGIKQLLYFKVYNRWGILVFETNSGNPALGWTGNYKGQPQPVETYTWIAEAIDIDNLTIKKSGSTLLIR